jgi:hypothetical protein
LFVSSKSLFGSRPSSEDYARRAFLDRRIDSALPRLGAR